MEHLILWSSIPLGEGFGFNGNILETNILNLGVVLGIVVSLGGDTLRTTLEARKQTIFNNLQDAEKRAQDAKERLAEAKSQLEKAQKRAIEIREQGAITANKEKEESTFRKNEEIIRLKEKKEETLRVEEQKAVSQVYNEVVTRVITKSKTKIASKLNSKSQLSVLNYQIMLFAKHGEKKKTS